MNKNQIQKLKTLIEKSRARLMVNAPRFALLLMYVRFVAVPGMDRISTNGNCIFFEPTYLIKLKDEDVDFIFCHQIMHILCEDIWRSETYAFSNFHYASDLKINASLLEEKAFKNSHLHFDKIRYKLPGVDKSPREMSVVEILQNLVFNLDSFDYALRKKYLLDSDIYWGRAPEVFGTTLIVDREGSEYIDILDESMLAADSAKRSDWQERAAIVLNCERDKNKNDKENSDENFSAGNQASLIERILKKLKKPTINWRKILNNFLCEQVCDYSFAPPDRRFTESEFFLPDFNETDFVSKEILFMVDTSGSINDKNLAAVYSEIKGALEQYNGKLIGKLGFFDFDSTIPIPMHSVDDLLSIVPVGGGGTNFYSIFSNLKDELPACIIIFTDGEGDFPPEEIAKGVPVMWIINNSYVKAPWGKTLRILPK